MGAFEVSEAPNATALSVFRPDPLDRSLFDLAGCLEGACLRTSADLELQGRRCGIHFNGDPGEPPKNVESVEEY